MSRGRKRVRLPRTSDETHRVTRGAEKVAKMGDDRAHSSFLETVRETETERGGGRDMGGRIEQKTSVLASQDGITRRASSPHTSH